MKHGVRKVIGKWGLAVAFVAGVLAYHFYLELDGSVIMHRADMEQLDRQLQGLQDENNQLFEELLRPLASLDPLADPANLPYDGEADARAAVREARARARQEEKFLMVTFGANWCPDCRNLHRHLESDIVQSYTRDRFLFVNVDVGKFNQNIELAEELDVSLRRGIPVAIFFDTDGQTIGVTNDGELEPARRYTSRQILKFVRDVAERSRILAPDAVR
jgi:thiol-disulfide isomerase/thioredoxin